MPHIAVTDVVAVVVITNVVVVVVTDVTGVVVCPHHAFS